jgi:catechol 2,3-dioxygenase-like lactoylglutathione lyase family enzyme
MIDHLEVAVSDLAASSAFYSAALVPLGYSQFVARENLGGFGTDAVAPDFWVRLGGPSQPLPHVAFRCASRALVERCYEAALRAGGRTRVAPTIMPQVHPSYFAAQVLDPDGHNVEFSCHAGE